MLRSDLGHIVLATSTAAIGAIMVACAVRGFALKVLNWVERILMFLGGVLFIAPGITLPLIGLAVLLVVLGWQYYGRKTVASEAA